MERYKKINTKATQNVKFLKTNKVSHVWLPLKTVQSINEVNDFKLHALILSISKKISKETDRF